MTRKEFVKIKSSFEGEVEIHVRSIDDLNDILYEQSTGFVDKDAGIRFNSFDQIFVSGPVQILPWSKKAQKLCVLIRMCLKTNKNLYACGLGFNILVFLSATNLNKWSFNIVNGKGKGGDIFKQKESGLDPSNLRANDRFLDNVTGDLFYYNNDEMRLESFSNCGLHLKKAAEDSKTHGHKVLNKRFFKESGLSRNKNSGGNEVEVTIRKQFYSNWMFSGELNHKFVVQNNSLWNTHAFNFKNQERAFYILGETKDAPVIILFKNNNIISTQYECSRRYPASLAILKNFIKRHMRDSSYNTKTNFKKLQQNSGKVESIFNVDSNWYATKANINDFNYLKKRNGLKNEFKHVGFCARNTGFQIIEDNSILRDCVRIRRPRDKQAKKKSRARSTTFDRLYRLKDKKAGLDKPKRSTSSSNKVERRTSKFKIKRNLINPVTIGNDVYHAKRARNFLVIETQDEKNLFHRSNALKKVLFGKANLREPEGFDYLDGWVPGYKRLHRKDRKIGLNNLQEDEDSMVDLLNNDVSESQSLKEQSGKKKDEDYDPNQSQLTTSESQDRSSSSGSSNEKNDLNFGTGQDLESQIDEKNNTVVSPTKFNEKISRIHKLRRFESKPKTVIFKKAQGRFFTKFKKRKRNFGKVKVKGFSKKLDQLKDRGDYYNPCEKDKIWDRLCKEGLKEMRRFRDQGARIYRLRDRYARVRSVGNASLPIADQSDLNQLGS